MFHAYVCNLFLTFAGNKLRLADWEQNCLPPPALFLLKGKQRREQDYRTYLPLFQSVQVPYCYCSGRTHRGCAG